MAMHHRVQRQRKAYLGNLVRDLHLAVKPALVAADVIRRFRPHALQGQLNMVHPGHIKRFKTVAGQSDT